VTPPIGASVDELGLHAGPSVAMGRRSSMETIGERMRSQGLHIGGEGGA